MKLRGKTIKKILKAIFFFGHSCYLKESTWRASFRQKINTQLNFWCVYLTFLKVSEHDRRLTHEQSIMVFRDPF